MRLFLTITFLCFFVDQLTKWVVEFFFKNQTLELLPILNLTLVYNRGFAFGIGQSEDSPVKDFLYTLVPSFVIALIFFIGLFKVKNSKLKVFLALIAGGGLGNLADRFFLGKVRDFIDFHLGSWHYPAFNIADICVSIGIFFILVYTIFEERKN